MASKPPSQTFILGAGFSKWISANMPLLTDLQRLIETDLRIAEEIEKNGLTRVLHMKLGFEALISHLANKYPWKTTVESHYENALYQKCIDLVVNTIEERQHAVRIDNLPSLAADLFTYWYGQRSTIITFNYDSLVELGLTNGRQVSFYALWKLPIVDILQRGEPTHGTYLGGGELDPSISNPQEYATVVKLHGSHNWLHSGEFNSPTDQVYFYNPSSKTPRTQVNSGGLRSLIIPPSIEKAPFLHHSLINIIWQRAREAIEAAERVFIVGYSLPVSDTYVELLLTRALRKSTKIYIVNTDESTQYRQRTDDYFSDKEVDLDFTLVGPRAVDDMIKLLVT